MTKVKYSTVGMESTKKISFEKEDPLSTRLHACIEEAKEKIDMSNGFVLVVYEKDDKHKCMNFNLCAFNHHAEVAKLIASEVPDIIDMLIKTAKEQAESTVH
jgi:hypothetical protein